MKLNYQNIQSKAGISFHLSNDYHFHHNQGTNSNLNSLDKSSGMEDIVNSQCQHNISRRINQNITFCRD